MSRNTYESPMDYEFQNGTGPVDSRSPFAQIQPNARRIPEGVNMTPRKRSAQNGFDSPSKSRMGTQQSSPAKPLPPTPAAFNGLFNTPRKPRDDFDDSSAGETPKSPERDDSDATPDIKTSRSALTRFNSASAPTMPGAEIERSSPSKQRPQSQRRESALTAFMTKAKNKFYSPGRGEIHRPEHAGAIEKASRRRRRDVDRRVRKRRHSMSDSGEDNDQRQKSSQKTEDKPHWAGSLFTFLAQHPSLPQTLSYYAQFLFNVFLLFCCGYLIYCFWSAVQSDVDEKANDAMVDIMAEMQKCVENYEKNRCDPKTRVSYMDAVCDNWKRCMEQDPRKVGRARVSAHTFAQIFNSFVEPISYKAMFFTAIMVFGCFGISNFAFGFFRNKAQQWQPNYGYGYGYGPPPPPTPQRSFSGPDGAFYVGTPWHQPPPGMGFEPQPSGGFGHIEGQGSPQRRLVHN